MKHPLIWLAVVCAFCVGLVMMVASCITSAPQPVFSTNVVMVRAPMPSAAPGQPALAPQLIPHTVVSETIAGQPVPLVTGHSNAPRNLYLLITPDVFGYGTNQAIGQQRANPGDQAVVLRGYWLQGNLTNSHWTNLIYLPMPALRNAFTVCVTNGYGRWKLFRLETDYGVTNF